MSMSVESILVCSELASNRVVNVLLIPMYTECSSQYTVKDYTYI